MEPAAGAELPSLRAPGSGHHDVLPAFMPFDVESPTSEDARGRTGHHAGPESFWINTDGSLPRGRGRGHVTAELDPRHMLHIVQRAHGVGACTRGLPEFQAPLKAVWSQCTKFFTASAIYTVLIATLVLALVRLLWDPAFASPGGEERPKLDAYLMIMGLVVCVVLLVHGVPQHFAYVIFVTVLAALGVIEKDDILKGFSRDGAWVPQLLLIIVGAIGESGLLEEALSKLLGTREARGRVVSCLRLQIACIGLGMLLGAGPTITVASPIVIRWAQGEAIPCGPPLMLLVVSATCGSVLLLTSSPISIVIREIMQRQPGSSLSITEQAPLALLLTVLLSAYAACAAPSLTSYDVASRRSEGLRGAPSEPRDDPGPAGKPAAAPLRPAGDAGAEAGAAAPARPAEAAPTAAAVAAEDGRGPGSEEETPRSFASKEPEECDDPDSVEHLHYHVDFVVDSGSVVCGLVPRSAGIRRSDGVKLLMLCRTGSSERLLARRRTLLARATLQQEWLAQTSDPEAMERWMFEAGDVIIAKCSVNGIIAMRSNPGVFVLRGLHCHYLLGGQRHKRRLYECVVAVGSPLVGQTLEEVLGLTGLDLALPSEHSRDTVCFPSVLHLREAPEFLRRHWGYPLAGWRRAGRSGRRAVPLSLSCDVLAPGDVVLIDAFEEFPGLPHTAQSFLVTSLVPNSQAPRHGRKLDKWRGIVAIGALLVSVALADLCKFPLVLGTLVAVVLLFLFRAVQVAQLPRFLSWPLLLTMGAGEGISEAFRKTGVAYAVAGMIDSLGKAGGLRTKLCALALVAQVMANCLSNAAAGLIIAPLAMEVAKKDSSLSPDGFFLLAVITCNMVLSTPFGTPSNAAISRLAGFTPLSFLRFGLPAQAIVTVAVVWWTFTFKQGTGALPDYALHPG